MQRLFGTLLVLALVPAFPAAAQQQLDSQADSSGTRVEIDTQANAMAARAIWAAERSMTRDCEKYGCLAIVNMTDNYDAVGLYLDAGPPTGHANPKWSPNQFAHTRLSPHQATMVLKSGDASMCGLPARVELKHQKSGEKVTILGEVDLCRGRGDSRLLIRVLTPQVTLEAAGPEPVSPQHP